MNVSYLIITHDRRDGLLANLQALYAGDAMADVWLVDNASTDGTADAVRAAFPRVRLIQLDRNLGMPARNVGLRRMTSEYVVLLDDDSHPIGDAVARSVAHMQTNRDVAAVVGRAMLPGGGFEAPAMPGVLLGCATCVRLRALRDVGFFCNDFFRQAEEYDLSLRLWDAGYRVERLEDVRYRHDKRPSPTRAGRAVASLDLKHNLILAARYLPSPMSAAYWEDFAWRYGAILADAGFADDVERVVGEAEQIARDPRLLRRQEISLHAFEAVFEHERQFRAVNDFSTTHSARRVAIADASKNLYSTVQACRRAGLDVTAIVDDRPAFLGCRYRDVPVIARRELNAASIDGVIVSNTNPAQVDAVCTAVGDAIDRPLLRLWTPVPTATNDVRRMSLRNRSSSVAA